MGSQLSDLQLDQDDPLTNVEAIGQCLNYLQLEATRAGLTFAAHLISVAAEAVGDSVSLSRKSLAVARPEGQRQPKNRLNGANS